jgi:hypothetical protein
MAGATDIDAEPRNVDEEESGTPNSNGTDRRVTPSLRDNFGPLQVLSRAESRLKASGEQPASADVRPTTLTSPRGAPHMSPSTAGDDRRPRPQIGTSCGWAKQPPPSPPHHDLSQPATDQRLHQRVAGDGRPDRHRPDRGHEVKFVVPANSASVSYQGTTSRIVKPISLCT